MENVFDIQHMGLTENGALTRITTESAIVDQFGKAGNYRFRLMSLVSEEQERLWEEDPYLAVCFPFYLRAVTRKTRVGEKYTTENVQNGQGARDESFKRLLSLAKNHKDAFEKNIWLLPVVGSWKDLWTLMYYDVAENIKAIDRNVMYFLLAQGLASPTHSELVKKYMPRIKSNCKLKTEWLKVANELAKGFANYMRMGYGDYNRLKTSGTAHDFQKIICSRRFGDIEWKKIPGRALGLLTNGRFLEKHGLVQDYIDWMEKQPTIKFTGYPFELAKRYDAHRCKKSMPYVVKYTIDAQFRQLVETARQNGKIKGNVWVALDTSGSMASRVNGLPEVTCEEIASSLAIFFAELNEGAFHNQIIMFDDTSYPYTLKGNGFCDKLNELPLAWGGTDFQSVVEAIAKIRVENPSIPLSDYPSTLLVVSDMQFSPTRVRYVGRERVEKTTNYEAAKATLKEVFPSDFVDDMKFIWWDCASRRSTYEGTADDPNIMFLSGFDGSIMPMLLNEDEKKKNGEKLTALDIVKKALSQEIFQYVEIE